MNKRKTLALKLITAAIGMLIGCMAQAQSSVTFYGLVDVGLLFTNKTLNTSTRQNVGSQYSLIDSGMSPSLFGLVGIEDLGGGLKAEFKLESGISVGNGGFDDSNGNLFARQAWVGLSGNLNEVKAGLQFSPHFLALYDLDLRGTSQFGSSLGLRTRVVGFDEFPRGVLPDKPSPSPVGTVQLERNSSFSICLGLQPHSISHAGSGRAIIASSESNFASQSG